MAYEQRDNSGAIFKNEKKETESHPNGTGKAMIGGVMYWVSAWTKDGAKGKWQSLAFKPVDQDAAQTPRNDAKTNGKAAPSFDGSDDYPF